MGIYGCFVYVYVGMCMHMYERKIGKVRNFPALILSFFLDSIEVLTYRQEALLCSFGKSQ